MTIRSALLLIACALGAILAVPLAAQKAPQPGEQVITIGRPSPVQEASIATAMIRQLKAHWLPPSGVEVEHLVTTVRFRLNPDGSLDGTPEVVRQTGITEANRPFATMHGDQAIRTVRLAAPFDLPERFYSSWRTITSNFDTRLAQ